MAPPCYNWQKYVKFILNESMLTSYGYQSKKKKITKLTFDDTKISDGLEFIYNKLFIMGNT